jgi:heme-degrading monooxygenase HmoA
MKTLHTIWLSVLLGACAAGSPLEGPGYNIDDGVLRDAAGPYLMVATHTRIAKGERQRFGEHVDAIKLQQDENPGFMARALRAEVPGRERWTLTMWEDEESVMDFTFSGAHLDAMTDPESTIDGVYSAGWWVEADELPVEWSDALDELAAEAPEEPW